MDEELTSTEAEIEGIKVLVEGVLIRHPETRNSDKELLYWCWVQSKWGIEKILSLEDFLHFPNFESIRRCRQAFNEEGAFLPTDPEVFKKRRLRAEDFRRIFGRDWNDG